ncbi:Fe2+-enterobactin ABC transporter substrate-binding protein [Saccharospirillum sp. MSK14-1]|uniref:Fe2+-enterobactin ABC transporter substrate-binding protein n=1 Tax=Saccharospirillum sp. MSK14-1 TaxID=1897632 RepID=UPI000D34FC55|nr:Fe2+-enterobactin ABC transporter substrate-binding protein [Saccharospirillum sp. MSK14-1]PTY38782.1 Fe2+-enterobactin ABC transporter substrate-binding protein [Saccharospirillum sp. MSK14-1]
MNMIARLCVLFGALAPLVGQADTAGWPREFINADGSTTVIAQAPERILSTSVTISGTLLAIDAPMIASATTPNGDFFGQWADVAEERHLQALWPAGRLDLEAAYAVAPDLIVVSRNGGDSALENKAQLEAIAPVIVLDYGDQTWQSLARRLGEATGLEAQVEQRIDGFDAYVARSREQMNLPATTANLISYNGPGMSNPIATVEAPQARLLHALGFEIEAPDPDWHSRSNRDSNDFVWAQYEHLTQLTAPASFLIRAEADRAEDFLNDPVLANLPSVQAGQVYGLGIHSFRIDYYSARKVVDGLVEQFGQAER